MARIFGFFFSLLMSNMLISLSSPQDKCWPEDSEWDHLNKTLDGQLIRFVPPASVCYPQSSNHNKTACDVVMKNWTSFAFHSSNPGSIASPWTLESCNPTYPNGTGISGARNARANGCKLGALPVYIVNATEAHHIQTAIKFADRWDVRLTIKNTGHDSYGRNTGSGSLSISRKWIPQVENSTTNAAEPVLAATIGAGVQDGELFNTLVRHDLIAVGGTNMDVGFVGWASGGGHGYMTVSSITTLPLTSFKDLLANLPDLGAVPVEDSITASRLITKEVVFNKTAEFAETLRIHGPQAKAPKGGIPNVSVSGILTISRKPVDNALNPSWRKAVVHLILSQSWSNETPDTKAKSIVKNMTYNKLDSLRQLDLSSGAYLNEVTIAQSPITGTAPLTNIFPFRRMLLSLAGSSPFLVKAIHD
ncbi:hypothetical protein FOXG_04641 [Fusarium oxysporum f. sp. lycopersici 4287]|uniref:FAD linked oxidase N-terminal domain-containing protein n=2 Tax=Fusarium oxysporum TaxID=5507 RepID=A0A0J9UQX4_FUSO4|nr:hypothetical protein FOXG_04641 [Fusarium oxysporum f. sp. lycopersici 4287]KNB01378.1 hypothetical protein FOXG_04641 [Fusarium oxysporum f. sp. lycopersici 4287]